MSRSIRNPRGPIHSKAVIAVGSNPVHHGPILCDRGQRLFPTVLGHLRVQPAQGIAAPKPAFLEIVPYRFGIADLAQHYHLPVKMTPWGFSLFRGGA